MQLAGVKVGGDLWLQRKAAGWNNKLRPCHGQIYWHLVVFIHTFFPTSITSVTTLFLIEKVGEEAVAGVLLGIDLAQ